MKTEWHLFIISFISILSLSSISCTAGPRKSLFTTQRKVFKVIKQSTTEERRPIQRISRSPPPSSELRRWRSDHPSTLLPVEPEVATQADLGYVSDVSVSCSNSDFEVRVNPAFYGLGADAQELTLGSNCRSNGVLRPQGDLVFTYPLTACGVVRELPHGYLVYKYVLHYEPSPKRFPSRAHQLDVNIECHYQRDHAVYQLAVQPTWQTVTLRKKLKGRPLDFHIGLMDDTWRAPAKSQVYLLGQTVNIQVSAPHLPPGLKLYVNSCYAAPSSDSKSSLKYTLIDNFGCMLDSKHEPGASQFVSQTDKTLRFSLRSFQFTADPNMKVSIHCKLSVSSEGPGLLEKSCTYKDHRWRALTGHDYICECCESTCVTSKPQSALLEGFVISMPVLVSDQPHTADDGYQQVSQTPKDADKLRDKDQIDHQNLWGVGVVEEEEDGNEWLKESENIDGAVMKPEVEESAQSRGLLEDECSESKPSDLKEFGEEDGFSKHAEAEDPFEAKGDEVTEELTIPEHHKRDDLLNPRVLIEEGFKEGGLKRTLKGPNLKKGQITKPACRREDDRRRIPPKITEKNANKVDEQEETWYFTWV